MHRMRIMSIGESQLQASVLGYGCWRIAGDGPSAQVNSQIYEKARSAIITAYEAGYSLFDLADIYGGGVAEEIFGRVLKEVSGMRDRIVIVTKAGICMAGVPNPKAPYRYDFSRDHLIEACEGSLKRMGIETIDIFLLHRPDFLCDPEEVASAFSTLHEQGKVKEFGVSNFRPSQVEMLQKYCSFPLRINQIECSVLHLDPFFDGSLDQCISLNITPQAWSPLGGGELFSPKANQHIQHLRSVLERIGAEHGVSAGVIALAWLLRHPAKIQPIVGSTNPDRIKEYAKAAGIMLSREEWYMIMEAAYGKRLP